MSKAERLLPPLDAFKDFFNNLGSNSNSDESTEENKSRKTKAVEEKAEKTMLDTYGTNLTEKPQEARLTEL